MVRVIVFGMGHLGRWHVDKACALEDSQLVAVVDPSPAALEKLQERNLDIPLFKSPEEAFAAVEFDAGIIVTPTSLHYDLCKKLLSLNKHIFCEKPMTSTSKEALEIEELVKEKGVVFQVGHSERYHSIWSEVKTKTNYFQNAPSFQLQRRAPFKGRATDVDVVQDLMIHDLDLLLFLYKEKPSRLKAIGHKVRTDKWDFVRAFIEYANGAHATITVGRNYVHEVREFEVINEQGSLHVDLFKRELKEASKEETQEFVRTTSYEGRDHLLEEQKLFYRAILKKGEPVVNETEGREAVTLVSKILESLDKGQWIEC